MDDLLLIGAIVAALWLQSKASAESISSAIQNAPGDVSAEAGNVITAIKDFFTPRGIRNNNPGNIRHSNTVWQGMSPTQTDPDFVQFISPEWGIRAIGKILDSYANQGINTIQGMINRWAPPSENATSAYVQAVSAAAGVDPNAPLNLAALKPQIVAAIVRQENGQQPYDMTTIANSVMMA